MIVGVTRWELYLPGCHSLKDKRRVVKSLKDRLLARFHVAAAEVDHLDLWQRAAIAAAVVSAERRHCDEVLSACDRLVQSEAQALVTTSETRYL